MYAPVKLNLTGQSLRLLFLHVLAHSLTGLQDMFKGLARNSKLCR